MITATARRHVEDAIRRRLRIPVSEIRDGLCSAVNGHLVMSVSRDMRGCVATCVEGSPWVDVHARAADGIHDLVLCVRFGSSAFRHWSTMATVDAYALPDGVVLRHDLPIAA